MTQNTFNLHHQQEVSQTQHKGEKRKRRCVFAVGGILFLLLLLFIISLILSLTIFKVKEPRTQLVSASVEGIAPRLSFPAIRIQLNVTFNVELLVENRNHASFKHGTGKTLLLYNGNQVGEADLYPGLIPAMGSTTLPCRLSLEVDRLASQMNSFIRDVLAGEFVMETHTRIPGRITFLGIFRKHAVTLSNCQMAIQVPDLKVRRQDCKHKTKF